MDQTIHHDYLRLRPDAYFLPTILIAYGTSIIILLEALLVREGDPNVMLRFEMHDALVAEAFDN
jgi:hypothetical protein